MSMTGTSAATARHVLIALVVLASGGYCLGARAQAPTQTQMLQQSRDMVVVEGDDIAFSRVENTQEFLPSRVGQIAQDQTGFMWFGTQYGLYRFDGYSHMAFAADARRANQPGGVFIHAISNDTSGRLWIATDQGLDAFDPRTGKFSRAPPLPVPESAVIQSIYQDPKGLMWLSTTAGLYGIDAEGTSRLQVRADAGDAAALSSNDLKFATRDKTGTLWVASGAGLEAIDDRDGRVITRVPLSEPREIGFVEDRPGVLWIHHAGGTGLSLFDRATNTLTHVRFVDAQGKALPRFGIFTALKDREGGLWFGTGGAGLLHWDVKRQRFVRYRHNPADSQSLSGDDISMLFQDRDGDIWVALHGEQLNLFSPRQAAFRKMPPRPADLPSRSERMVNALLEVDESSLWISYMGMLLAVDLATGEREDLRQKLGLQSDVIAIAKDNKGRIWLGTVGTGLVRVDPSGAVVRFKHAPGDTGSLANDVVNAILVDAAGSVWFATWGGLSRYDEVSGRFHNHRPAGMDPKYLALAEDSQGNLWLGTHRYGLQRFDPVTLSFATYAPSAAPGGISNGRVNAVHVDRRGIVWAGTQNGLDALDPASGTMRHYRTQEGLPSNAISCILEDERNGIWLGTHHGIARLDAQDGSVRSYSRMDGLPGMDFTGWGTCQPGRHSVLYFGGFSGATAFNPNQLRLQRRVPPVVITDLSIAGRRYPDGSATPQPRVLPALGRLRLPYAQNSFTAGFAALSYAHPTAVAYRFRLRGLEQDWHHVDSDRRVAAYNSLPPGDYRLEVQAAVSAGQWSDTQGLAITILQPWWRTTWFHLLVGALLLAAAWLAYRFRVRQVTQRLELRLEERVAERTRIARELHDSLLQGFHGLMFRLQAVRNLLPARPDEAASALEVALHRGDETVEMARAAVTDLRSAASNDTDLELALRAMLQDAPTLAAVAPPSCELKVIGAPRTLIQLVHEDVLQVAREAFRNALQHARAAHVWVEVEWGIEHFKLRVRDDGVGLDPAVIAHGRDRHWGMQGMRERTRALGGNLEIRSEGAGTQVELRIPAGRAYARMR